MQTEDLSPSDSIALIQSMINKTKNAVSDNSVFFLLWGWVVFGACILQYVLKNVLQYQYHYYAWFLIIIGIVGSIYFGMRRDKNEKVKTYVSESIDNLWIAIGVSFVVFAFIFARIGYQHCFSFYILLYGIGCFVTGRLIKFSPLVWGGIGAWLLAILSAYLDYDTNILVTAVSILISYIIPGYLLKNKFKKNKSG